MNVNKVILVGRLTRDPDMRTTTSGQQVATLSMATNNFWTDKSGTRQERTEFHSVVLWGRLAEIAGQYLTKGQECYIEGRLQSREYTAKDGAERKVTEIVGETMQLGSRAQGQGTGGQGAARNAAPAAAATAKPAPVEEEIPTINLDDEKDEIKIEDVPF
ncbi:MAG: single-stranded DNA-binding protein [Candidatus Moranbacteria bacterium]|jgi:single-strand DNA-binding protein|nr:single-stranded DNA-binding protein [Candidatus Moranbacteria bacterium]